MFHTFILNNNAKNYRKYFLAVSTFGRRSSSNNIPYLSQPFINIHNPRDNSHSVFMLPEQVKYSKILFAKPIHAHPVFVAQTIHNLPCSNVPQVAIVGRSNVGKSSLINSLVHGKEIARTSATPVRNSDLLHLPKIAPVSNNPGRTRHLFIFDLSDHLSIVDLPGYGYAKVPKQIRNDWAILIEEYFNRSNNLKRVISLIEASRVPEDLDFKLWEMLMEKRLQFQVVITKVDLLRPLELHSLMLRMIATIDQYNQELVWPYIHAVSARNHLGIDELRCSLSCIASDNRRFLKKQILKPNEVPYRQKR